MGNKEERSNKASDGNVETTGRHRKSARPGKITYVPINDEDLAPYVRGASSRSGMNRLSGRSIKL